MSPKIHIHLHASDLAKSREFYRKFFGAAPVKEKPGYVKFLPQFAPINLAISEGHSVAGTASGQRPGWSERGVDHLGVQVESTEVVMALLDRVKASGLRVREEMGVNCCHANQDKFWVQDPDGVEWEVYHLNYDLEEETQVRSEGSSKPAVSATSFPMAKVGACCAPQSTDRQQSAGRQASASREEATMSDHDTKASVRQKYGQAASRVTEGGSACCGPVASRGKSDPITSNLYETDEIAGLPPETLEASLGCGNPVALAELKPGETVLDLGSGGGIDVLLSARRVGPTGKAYGLDMTDEMLALARENQAKAGVRNVEFLKGEIEAIPLPDASVDVIVSNCVINLSPDKPRVFAEAFRVLKPGGRFAVSDIVVRGTVPEIIRRSMEAWTGCLAGALEEDEYITLLAKAGFETIEVEPTRIYRAADAREFLESAPALVAEIERRGLSLDDVLVQADGKYLSAFIRAVKPSHAPLP